MTNTEITLLTELIIAILYCIYLKIRLRSEEWRYKRPKPDSRQGNYKEELKDTSRFPGHREPPPPPARTVKGSKEPIK